MRVAGRVYRAAAFARCFGHARWRWRRYFGCVAAAAYCRALYECHTWRRRVMISVAGAIRPMPPAAIVEMRTNGRESARRLGYFDAITPIDRPRRQEDDAICRRGAASAVYRSPTVTSSALDFLDYRGKEEACLPPAPFAKWRRRGKAWRRRAFISMRHDFAAVSRRSRRTSPTPISRLLPAAAKSARVLSA